MALKVGDKVRLKDEPGEGIVLAVDGSKVTLDFEGMELQFAAHDLVKVEFDNMVQKADLSSNSKEEKSVRIKSQEKLRNIGATQNAVYELDLHIHELLDHFEHMTAGQRFSHQMTCCRSFIREAIDKKYPKVVLIHGVGEGVLRAEIHRWLDSIDQVDYYDAPYRTYGYGATEVRIR